MMHKHLRLGMVVVALALAAAVAGCELLWVVTGAPGGCEVAVDTVRLDTLEGPVRFKPQRCVEEQ